MEQTSFKQRLDPAMYDAVHRALLTGLLSNVGYKGDAGHEYTGARGTKFFLFPGSALFKVKPQWVMSAELVETTRLYARTVAAIRVEWVERIADHLVKRTYSDPHWNPQTGHVVAYEKVTLYGMTIVPKRTVHYGPIDPKLAREIFIKGALVEGDSNITAPFIRHNQRLVDEITTLEAKTRQRGLLVTEDARFDFYDARIPAGIHNVRAFETWRRQTEAQNTKLLHMTRRDLLAGTADVTQDLFPDSVQIDGLRLALEYHFEPGHPADGVTVAVPLATLNQVPGERFEWVVPGLLKEKVIALIKSLPKPLRVQFIPAPDVAQRALDKMKLNHGSLLDALAEALGKISGTRVTRNDFDLDTLAEHLKMNFKVVDESGKVLAAGRDLDALRRQLGFEVKQRFNALPQSQWNRDGITRWDFDDLPDSVEIVRNGMALKAYPAILDNPASPDSVSLRLFDTPEAARGAMRTGLRKLFMLQLDEPIRHLQRMLPNVSTLCLNYATLGTCDELKRDIVTAAVDRALFEDGVLVRTRDEFVERAETGWRRLSAAANELATTAGGILALYQDVSLALSKPYPPLMSGAVEDLREQLAHLVPRDFILFTPSAWLPHVARFLRAMQVRLKKLTNAGLARDNQGLQVVRPLWLRWRERAALHAKVQVHDPELVEFRWMLEELRVSLFAQELKTSIPISVQRLERQWSKVRLDRAWISKT
jgi:ATP-dependent helicase HrpA